MEEPSKPAPAAKKSAAKNKISQIIGKKKTTVKPKGAIGRPPKAASATTKKPSAKPKANAKYKSAEIIEDSDVEFDVEDMQLQPPPPAPSQAARKSVSPAQPMSMQRTVSKSSSVTASDTENGRQGGKRPAPSSAVSPAKRPRTSGATPVGADSQMSVKSTSNPDRKPATKSVRREEHSDTEGGRKGGKRPVPSGATSPTKRPRTSDTSSTAGSSSQNIARLPPKPHSRQDAASVRSLSNSPIKPSPLGSSPPINASNGAVSSASSPAMTPGDSSTASQSPLDALSARSRPRSGTNTTTKRKTTNVAVGSSQKQSKIDAQILQLARNFREEYQKYVVFYTELQQAPRNRLSPEKIRRLETWGSDLEAMKRRIESATSYR